MRPEEGQGRFDCRILAGRAQAEMVQQTKQGLAMALVEAPEEREIVVLCIGGIGEAIVQDRLRMLPTEGLHGRQADLGVCSCCMVVTRS